MIRPVSVLAYVISSLTLSGCVEPEPNVAWEQMNAACKSGDTQACAVILDQQQKQKDAYLRAQQPTGPDPLSLYTAMAPRPSAVPPAIQPLGATQKVCPNGLIVPVNYICTP